MSTTDMMPGINVVGMSSERAWEIACAAIQKWALFPTPEPPDEIIEPVGPDNEQPLSRIVAGLINEGHRRKQVAAALGITPGQFDTARKHAKRQGWLTERNTP